jgi:hypothetical protein
MPEGFEQRLFPRVVERARVLDHANRVGGTTIDGFTQALAESDHGWERKRVQ